MNTSYRYTLLAAGMAAALPQLALAHSGTHPVTAVAHLTYAEAYAEKLKGGQEVGTELLVLTGHYEFNEHVGIADITADTEWTAAAQGKALASGTFGEASKKKFGAKNGMATINLSGGGTLKFTWNAKAINFTLKWKGAPALAAAYKDKDASINVSQFPVDITIGSLQGFFNVPITGQASTKTKNGITLSKVALKGSANSAGLDTLDRDSDSYTADVDCNDYNAKVYPGATEATLDGVDSNCDGRDSGVAEVVETFKNPGMYSSPAVNFKSISLPQPVPDNSGPLRDFSGYNKSFAAPAGKTSFYDPSTGTKWNDDTMTPVTDGQDIWRGWTHTGKWSFFNGAAGDKITLSLQPDAADGGLKGAHPGFILFWRPEGGPVTWEGTQDIAAGQTVPANSDIVVGHVLVQRADWTVQGLPAKTDHTAPAGVDSELYPMKPDSYTMYYVDSGYDADKYDAAKKLIMHPTALKGLALSDGIAGTLSKTITLPKTGYYLLYTGNVLEVDDWGIGTDGKLAVTGPVWELPGKAAWINIKITKP
ncbi:MAG: putative metal-binding motif-containing protein [Methylococcus sp.]|nr:putative metal-binding motif-containing protein [Methylococcus sp.]